MNTSSLAGRPGRLPGLAGDLADEQTSQSEGVLLVVERHEAVRDALTHLPRRCQRLIALLIEDPSP
jgi:DNA-directed RNA polymerase specialized sigma24 family protein